MEHSNGTSTHMGAREGVGLSQHPGNERSMNHTWENREHDEHEGLHMNGGGMSRQAKRPMSYNGDMGRKAKKMKKYKQMCEKALDRMSALYHPAAQKGDDL